MLEFCQPLFIYYYFSPYFWLAALQYRTFLRALKHGFGLSCFRNLHLANSFNFRHSLKRKHDAKLQAIFCYSDIIANMLACASMCNLFGCVRLLQNMRHKHNLLRLFFFWHSNSILRPLGLFFFIFFLL